TVPVGATSAAFEVQLADDTQKEEDEAVTFLIYSTSADLGVGEQRTFTLTIEDNDQTPTGIADATKGQFSVFPNPVQDFVRLSLPDRVSAFPNISLVAYGLDGRMLFSARGSLEGVQQVLNGEVASLKHGLYILKIEAGKEVFVTRMLKK
ncbi:MAG: T9SS type A sorting domain-containing protein, partial [Hymenobacteraceae bacterium]|nr:T9SS type A sorting domain-containing protein [Hymenobacteraceae bacterium]